MKSEKQRELTPAERVLEEALKDYDAKSKGLPKSSVYLCHEAAHFVTQLQSQRKLDGFEHRKGKNVVINDLIIAGGNYLKLKKYGTNPPTKKPARKK
jgi:hypothetical protein